MNTRPPLEEALGIPGARAVSLLDPERSTVLWWAGAGPPDERQTAAVVTLAAAAAGLVMLAEPGDELGDVLLTSAEAFHVVRLMTDGPLRVAHLTLRRTEANLAMARREFRSLLETYARQPHHTTHPHNRNTSPDSTHRPDRSTHLEPARRPGRGTHLEPTHRPDRNRPPDSTHRPDGGTPPEPTHRPDQGPPPDPTHWPDPSTSLEPASWSGAVPEPAEAAGPAPLPRRARVDPSLPAQESLPDLPPALLNLLSQLYTVNDGVLNRILATLHHL